MTERQYSRHGGLTLGLAIEDEVIIGDRDIVIKRVKSRYRDIMKLRIVADRTIPINRQKIFNKKKHGDGVNGLSAMSMIDRALLVLMMHPEHLVGVTSEMYTEAMRIVRTSSIHMKEYERWEREVRRAAAGTMGSGLKCSMETRGGHRNDATHGCIRKDQ